MITWFYLLAFHFHLNYRNPIYLGIKLLLLMSTGKEYNTMLSLLK